MIDAYECREGGSWDYAYVHAQQELQLTQLFPLVVKDYSISMGQWGGERGTSVDVGYLAKCYVTKDGARS